MSPIEPSSLHSLCFTNLCLLGFVQYHQQLTATTAKRPSGRVVSPTFSPETSVSDSFYSNNSSIRVKITEAALWFLFHKLDPNETQKRLSSCWPILDRNQSREFRNSIFRWLEALKKNGDLPNDVAVRRSYFDECRGERFEQLLASFSNFALKTVLNREFHPCQLTPTNIPIQSLRKHYPAQVEMLLQRHIQLQTESVIRMSCRELELEDGYKRCAELISKHWVAADKELANVKNARQAFSTLTSKHRPGCVRKSRSEKESIYDGSFDRISSKFGIGIGREDHEQTLNRLHAAKDKQVQRVAEIWDHLLAYIRNNQSRIDAIDHVISQQMVNELVLDATKSGVLKIPQALLRIAKNETTSNTSTISETLQKMQEELYSGNLLSLPTLLSVVRFSFIQLLEIFRKHVSGNSPSDDGNTLYNSLPTTSPASGNVSTILKNMRNQTREVQEIKEALKARLQSAEIRMKGRLAETKTTFRNDASNPVKAITNHMDFAPPTQSFSVAGLLELASDLDPRILERQKQNSQELKAVNSHENLLASSRTVRADARRQASCIDGRSVGKSPTHPRPGMNENVKSYATYNACENIEPMEVGRPVKMLDVVNTKKSDFHAVSGRSKTKQEKENTPGGITACRSSIQTQQRTQGAAKPSVLLKATTATNLGTRYRPEISLGSRPSKPSLLQNTPDARQENGKREKSGVTNPREVLATTPRVEEQKEQTARPYDILCDQIVEFVNADQCTAASTPQRRGKQKGLQVKNLVQSRNHMSSRDGAEKPTRQTISPLQPPINKRPAAVPMKNSKPVARPHRIDNQYELALCDPLSAMETTAFRTKSELPRTPDHRSTKYTPETNATITSPKTYNKEYEASTPSTSHLGDTTFEIGSPDISITLPPVPSMSRAPGSSTQDFPKAMPPPGCKDNRNDSISCYLQNETMGTYAMPSSPSFSMSFASAVNGGNDIDPEFWPSQPNGSSFEGGTEEDDEFILNASLQIEPIKSNEPWLKVRTSRHESGSPVREEGHSTILNDLPMFATPGGTRNLDLADDLFDEGMPEFLSDLQDDLEI